MVRDSLENKKGEELVSFLTFHFDMKLSQQVLQFALEHAHILYGGHKDQTDHIESHQFWKTRTITAIGLSQETDGHKTAKEAEQLIYEDRR